MKRYAFLTVVVISSYAALFLPDQNQREFFVGIAFETGNTGIINTDEAETICTKTCFRVDRFHVSLPDNLDEPCIVFANFSTAFDNPANEIGITDGKIKISLVHSCERPQWVATFRELIGSLYGAVPQDTETKLE